MLKSWGALAAIALGGMIVGFAVKTEVRVGDKTPDGIMVPTGQAVAPAGKLTVFTGRPHEVIWEKDGKHILAKTIKGLLVIDAATGAIAQELLSKTGSSMTGMALSADGKTLLTSDSANQLQVAAKNEFGDWVWSDPIVLPAAPVKGNPHPCGIAWVNSDEALVAMSRSNQAALVSVSQKKVIKVINLDPCPVAVKILADGRAAFACWSGAAASGDKTQESSGTPIPISKEGIALGGSLVIVDLKTGASTKTPIGRQGMAIAENNGLLYIACGSEEAIEVVSAKTGKMVKRISLVPVTGMKKGIGPNGLALSEDKKTLYAACGGLNAIAAIDLAAGKVLGWIPTGWYPGGIDQVGGKLAAASIKGYGSRAEPDPMKRDVYQNQGIISNLAEPTLAQLKSWTPKVVKQAVAAKEANLKASRTPVPVPAKLGDPSLIKHVVYVIKENRTYDQVFGDHPMGEGEPRLAMFGKDITPNHRALADRFGLLDNYYCNGVNSADGHAWTVEGKATTYFERSFGGWTRSYPFGDDPLAVSTGGFIWDAMLDKGLTFRNFGEFDYTEPTKKEDFLTILRDFESGKRQVKFTHKVGVERLRKHTSPDYPGWNMGIPDVLRAQVFIDEFKGMEKKGNFPNFTIIYLPQDHHSGAEANMPTPRAHLADNDLALGRVVETISKSKFWKETAIFVIEDDPQGGFDHIDGHRSICLVISPYSRPGTNSTFYSQSAVVGTMRRILGLPPLTYFDSISPLMAGCFQSKPNLAPYTALKNKWPLDEINPKKEGLVSLDLSGPDRGMEVERNRQAWYTVFPNSRFPQEVVGPHGRGLASRGLVHGDLEEEEEEEEGED